MIGITERAKDMLLDVRESIDPVDPHTTFRLGPNNSGQLELSLDLERDGDQVLEHKGTRLLLIADNVSQALSGSTIDCTQTSEGVQLTVNRSPGRDNGRAVG